MQIEIFILEVTFKIQVKREHSSSDNISNNFEHELDQKE